MRLGPHQFVCLIAALTHRPRGDNPALEPRQLALHVIAADGEIKQLVFRRDSAEP
ncbi:MAG: hypothetical protein ACTSWI_01120 [Alphaproteobacteria bacterium]